MTTGVKDVRSMFLNQTVPAAGKAGVSGGDFQKVWSSQMSKGASDGTVRDTNVQNHVSGQRGDSAQENTPVQKEEEAQPEKVQSAGQEDREVPSEVREESVSGENEVQETESEAEAQLRAMEVLGTATARLMEQIADVFGVTMEELQAAMDSLGMGQADLLDPSRLGSLLLELGGAQDSYALLTDAALYDNYRMIMDQLNQTLQESAAELGTDPEQLSGLLKDSMQVLQGEIPPDTGFVKAESLEEGLAMKPEGNPTADGSGMQDSVTAVDVVEEEAAAEQDAGGREQSGRQAESRTDRGEQVNLFAQSFRAEQFRPELQQTQGAAQESSWSAGTRQIMDQILDYMKLSLNADTTSLEMQLHPASLGTLQVQIASKGGVVTANFIAQNEAVKAALESQMIQLREQFEEQGVKVEAIEVTVQTHEFEQNLEQGRGRSQQGTERRSRGRKLRLDGVMAADAAEAGEAAEADRITAGESTVSYSA